MQQNILKRGLIGRLCAVGLLSVGLVIVPTNAQAAGCTFTQDLQLGVMNEEVRCLQKYLNTSGFTISESGVGSAGRETTEFKLLTEAAVIKWQKANKVSPASGLFGPKSRLVYTALQSEKLPTAPTAVNTSATLTLETQLQALKAQLATATTAKITTAVAVQTTAVKKANSAMLNVLDAIDNAKEAIDDNDDAKAIDDAKDSLVDAYDDFMEGLRLYLDGYLAALRLTNTLEAYQINLLEEETMRYIYDTSNFAQLEPERETGYY